MGNVRSMTGYGRENFSLAGTDFSVEVSSVNQRGLAVSVSSPSEWAAAERALAPLVRGFAARGKVSVAVRAGTRNGAAFGEIFSWDEAAVAKILEKMRAAAARAGTPFEPNAATYLRLAELCRTQQGALPPFEDESVAAAVTDATLAALKNFAEMREREGANLESDLRARLARLREWREKIAAASAGTTEHYRAALRQRLVAIGAEFEFDLDDPRILKEIALFADRCDVSEELTRLASHFSQFENCLDERECGRKLDFICQEILRELNTIGSKANNSEITRCVVEAKNEQERLREQVQNIE